MTDERYPGYAASRSCADTRSLCHAPTYGMHLAQNGTVLACSNTRGHPLGRYPEQTLEEIWFGPTAHALRAAMRGRDFPASCTACAAQAQPGLFERMRARDYDALARSPGRKSAARFLTAVRTGRWAEYPRSMAFELSNTCNLECVMCLGGLSSSIRQNREKLPPLPQHYGPELLEQLRPFIPHLQEALFFGGEPFLMPLYLDVLELFAVLNPACKIYVTTNGTVVNERVKRLVASLRRFEIVVSLDAVTRETYESIRVNARFDQVMSNVRQLQGAARAAGQRLVIKATLMTKNAAGYEDAYDFANHEGLGFDSGLLVFPPHLSLANRPVAELERLHARLSRHQPAPCADAALAAGNARAFGLVVAQVAAWLEDRRRFEADPRAAALEAFTPRTLMESCLWNRLVHSLKTTPDLGMDLRLAELRATDGPQVHSWCDATLRVCGALQADHDGRRAATVEALRARIGPDWAPDRQMAVVLHLLTEVDPWLPVTLVDAGDVDGLWALMAQAPERTGNSAGRPDAFSFAVVSMALDPAAGEET